MRGQLKFKVSTPLNKFEIKLCSKYTLLAGDSGTYKTQLFSAIRDYDNEDEEDIGDDYSFRHEIESKVYLDSPVPVIALQSKELRKIEELTASIIIIDESANRISKGSYAKLLKDSDCYFIFINRRYVKQYPINMNSLFKLEEDSDNVIRNYLYYPELEFENLSDCYSSNILIAEDSSSGKKMLEAIYSRDVQTLNGKDNTSRMLEDKLLDNSIVFADAAAFAQVIINLREDFVKHNIQFILYQSIEWLMLHAEEFEEACEILKDPSQFIDSREYNSWERYFTDLFIMMCEKYFDGYKCTKSELPQQILSDTNLNIFRDIMPKILPLFKKNELSLDETYLFY